VETNRSALARVKWRISRGGSVKPGLRLASIISAVLNAPFVAAYTFIAMSLLLPGGNWWYALPLAVFFATVVPVVSVYVLLSRKLLKDPYASDRRSRRLPLAIAVVSYALGTASLAAVGATPVATALMACYSSNTLLVLLISLRWKISVHTSGITGPATALIYSVGAPGYLFMLMVLPVAWARMVLGAHDRLQVVVGAALAIPLTYLQLAAFISFL
jgi:hypothetical protein